MAILVNPMQLVCSKIEVWPVADYLPQLQAYASGDPEQFPRGPNVTDEQWAAGVEMARQHIDAATVDEAVEMWRSSPAAATAVHTARRRAQGGAW